MKVGKIRLDRINKDIALRYCGMKKDKLQLIDDIFERLEPELLQAIDSRYVYEEFTIKEIEDGESPFVSFDNCELELRGHSITEHLRKCEKAIFICLTLSADVDRLIRQKEVLDMTEAYLCDAAASAVIEDALDLLEEEIHADYSDYYMTFRFGIGYGDLSLEHQKDFLRILDSQRKIGVGLTSGNMLSPAKSVTVIIGLSREEIKEKKRNNCLSCRLRSDCEFRRKGIRCYE